MKVFNTLLDNFLHILELLREVIRPGGLSEWHRVDPAHGARTMRLPIPKGDSCYPHHGRLNNDQLVSEEEFG